jgi:hypothetical protein
MSHEAPEWPRSNLGSFELGAPDPIRSVSACEFILVPGPQNSYQKWHLICYTVKFVEQNLKFVEPNFHFRPF